MFLEVPRRQRTSSPYLLGPQGLQWRLPSTPNIQFQLYMNMGPICIKVINIKYWSDDWSLILLTTRQDLQLIDRNRLIVNAQWKNDQSLQATDIVASNLHWRISNWYWFTLFMLNVFQRQSPLIYLKICDAALTCCIALAFCVLIKIPVSAVPCASLFIH